MTTTFDIRQVPTATPAAMPTYREAARSMMSDLEARQVSKRTVAAYTTCLKRQLKCGFGDLKLDEMPKSGVSEYYRHVCATVGVPSGNLDLAVISAIYTHYNRTAEEPLVSPTKGIKPLKHKPKQVVYVGQDLARLKRAIGHQDRYYGTILRCLLYTGLRWSSLVAIKREDIDLSRGLLTVNTLKGKGDDAGQVLPLSTQAVTAIKTAMHFSQMIDAKSVWVFPSSMKRGEHIGRINFAKMKAIFDPSFSQHSLRRTFGSAMSAAECSDIHIKQALCHSLNLGATNNYIHKNVEALRKSVQAGCDFIDSEQFEPVLLAAE